MESILSISKAVVMLGKQRLIAGDYRPSVYNLVVPHEEHYFVYNLFARGMLRLTAEEYALFQATITVDPSDIDPFYSFLIENYFFVPSHQDEQKTYLEMNDLIHLMDHNPYIQAYTVLTTTACNARCFYCFEQDFVPVSMTKETAHRLVDYMIDHSDGRRIHIHWFGGEPLCNVPVIDQITTELQERGVDFISNMTSNGYAFTPDIVARMKDKWKINFVQITLDGMEEEHNRRKNFKAATGSPFLRTMENIHMLLKADVLVSIRINFDPNNIDSVKELLPYLVNEFSGEKKLMIYVAKIFEDCGTWKSGRTSDQSIMMHQLYEEFTQYLTDHKFARTKPADNAYKYYYCGANNSHHRTIGPDGKFLLCHNLSAEEGYGSIFEGITDRELFERWVVKSNAPERCNGCPLLPECTSFHMCPSTDNNCVETVRHGLQLRIMECYRRYLKYQNH